ncbi:hypothetical protein JM93_00347 [Roseibium hamelinense]|uniref:Uncharacterized protein n=1 Tax=Roseibium hamelinense TaxID=150831 RepID=A0A562TGQ6_9HYPH|nr:hypothetical protein [Roseibium hamelinense]MTI46010.1 hypothetical protein [Roseibium hamelinense]TWI92799.1 hypothetical protein JM93_00347 [Roseibium hamelinense]
MWKTGFFLSAVVASFVVSMVLVTPILTAERPAHASSAISPQTVVYAPGVASNTHQTCAARAIYKFDADTRLYNIVGYKPTCY